MAKDKEEVRTDEVTVIPDAEYSLEFTADPDLEPMTLAEAYEEYDLGENIIEAAKLEGKTFLIMSAKSFKSKFDGERDPFFVDCFDRVEEEAFSTILGGKQPVDIITKYIVSGAITPLEVTLQKSLGGQSGWYWELVTPEK